MKILSRTIAACAILFYTLASIGACALIGQPIAEEVAKVIDDYCQEPFSARQVYRDTVNRELAANGHSISVTCAGDPTP